MEKQKGKFIVIDGTDATGKATQTAMLRERMVQEGYGVQAWSFPQYENVSSMAVWLYLERREGHPFQFTDQDAALADLGEAFDAGQDAFRQRLIQVLAQISPSPWGADGLQDPYAPSLCYAIDRAAARRRISESLEIGTHCVSDRYVSANLIHQGSKIANTDERREFIQRIWDLEYGWLKLPKPDINFLLLLDPVYSEKLQQKKLSQLKIFREPDAHEKNAGHQRAAYQMCRILGEMFPQDFTLIECATQDHAILSPEDIHEKIWQTVKPLL